MWRLLLLSSPAGLLWHHFRYELWSDAKNFSRESTTKELCIEEEIHRQRLSDLCTSGSAGVLSEPFVSIFSYCYDACHLTWQNSLSVLWTPSATASFLSCSPRGCFQVSPPSAFTSWMLTALRKCYKDSRWKQKTLPYIGYMKSLSIQTRHRHFQEAHFIIFLDDLQPLVESNDEQDDKDHTVSRVAERFRCYGQLIEANAQKDVRVIVAGDSFVNLKCSLLIENAPSVDPHNFVAMTTQLEYEAKTQLAQKLSVKTAGKIVFLVSV